MAEASSADKSEKASAQKLRKAREQGQVARSRDVATAIGIFASLKLLLVLMPGYLEDFRRLFVLSFANVSGDGALDNSWSTLFPVTMWLLVKMVLPLCVVPLAAIIAGMIPGGWVFNASHWLPKFERMNPLANLGRMVSAKHYSQVGLSILKAVVLGALIWHVCTSRVGDFLQLQGLPLGLAIARGADLLMDSIMLLCLIFIAFALIDLPVQILLFLRSQRMTKQEQKDEYKTSEGRPEVRNRIRQLQRQIAQRSLRKAVPGANVVIVNPTHYSVALKYDENRAEAPFVVAKGVDEMALYIRELAKEHDIEVLPLPPLARAIYHTSQVNQQIPAALYNAVAQVLTYVLQLDAFRHGRRKSQPAMPTDFTIPEDLLPKART
ncbi:flagellar type III secretion system protein FlhB [Jeongeupia naejangsanensis]|uniref:Flagellar type III secretion system protein FlhB n=1 Tax=Jeongeupia naejangsanensis TaxID=613195 RepID=A0ABS2BGJ2_9NEIS|nr:flagellar type III secretion system protein FlhB [Jeongeupia naejangsanensis]MBM3114729.1 flagellar type III secretion system protein FlhB [Jeongeupia naejangsanensis]